ncbi:uncharacterized protein [Chelonus insularis]|uniref:uncharacterized protein n=1 Tax=Chelonus insularis TaxID=460826 RepID=UPI00158EC2BD|nr:uncharacterized protein LOC118072423 [Chelonus insularis]
MPPSAVNITSQLISAIKKFKFHELESIVLPLFPETTWHEIQHKLIKKHEAFTTTNVVKIIVQLINEKEIIERELRKRLTILEVTEVSRHSNRKIWYGYELKQKKNGASCCTLEDIRNSIERNLNMLQLKMEINLITHESVTYLSMREKKASHRILPIFMALLFDLGYFFCSKKSVTKEFLHVITESSGYTSYKKLSLSGRDIKSLVKILHLKKQGVITSNVLCNPADFQEAEALIRDNGIDFRQHKQRKEYLQQCFGNEPPILEVLAVNKSNTQWADDDISKKLSDINFNMQWEFKSHNITNFLVQLTEKRLLSNPLPNYITNFLSSGKNELNLKTRDTH